MEVGVFCVFFFFNMEYGKQKEFFLHQVTLISEFFMPIVNWKPLKNIGKPILSFQWA